VQKRKRGILKSMKTAHGCIRSALSELSVPPCIPGLPIAAQRVLVTSLPDFAGDSQTRVPKQLRRVFDPNGILNPGKMVD
jgi:hypothetical protein